MCFLRHIAVFRQVFLTDIKKEDIQADVQEKIAALCHITHDQQHVSKQVVCSFNHNLFVIHVPTTNTPCDSMY